MEPLKLYRIEDDMNNCPIKIGSVYKIKATSNRLSCCPCGTLDRLHLYVIIGINMDYTISFAGNCRIVLNPVSREWFEGNMSLVPKQRKIFKGWKVIGDK